MKLVGQLIYNGVSFNGSSHVNLQVEAIRDDADRTTIYNKYTLTVQAVIYDPNDTGGQFDIMRQKLLETGAQLLFTGQGAGTIDVNGVNQRDVKWGPKPRILGWAPIGSLNAFEVLWTCEFCLPNCIFLTYPWPTKILAFNFQSSYSIDYKGATTRTISGYIEIAQTRNGRVVPDTADSYRTTINPLIPLEFQRTTQDFRLSLDKSRLDFNIVDVEIPSDNPYPLGVAKIEARHAVNWTRSSRLGGFLNNRISVSIELGFDQPTDIAYDYFVRIVKERINKAKANGKNVLFDNLNVEEGLFDRTSNFSCSYRFVCAIKTLVDLNTAVRQWSGLFDPLTTSPTWTDWRTSMAGISGTRGYQGLSESAADDKIVDICTTTTTMAFTLNRVVAPDAVPPPEELGITNTTPDSENSWLDYQHTVEIQEDSPIARQSILQAPPAAEPIVDLHVVTADPDEQLTFPTAAGTADVIQYNGQPRYVAIVRGTATRAAYSIPRPNYPTIGAATATKRSIRFAQTIAGQWLGVPIYRAIWEIVYDLDKSPGQVDELENIEQGVTV